MKINRLLEITILLMNRGTVTAKMLAERFEVSTRTIYRDIEVLSSAGVPIYTNKGKGGGISLLEDYSLNKTFLSNEESESLILALQTMGATRYPETHKVLEKLGAMYKNAGSNDWIEIDFAGWSSSPNEKNKLHIIKNAIQNKNLIAFDYINTEGIKSRRIVEPEKLYFSLNTWYLVGFCRLKTSSRIFRLSRIKNTADLNEKYTERERTVKPFWPVRRSPKPHVKLKLFFTEQALYRLYDEFDESCISKTDKGYEVNVVFPENEWVYGFLLSFGPYVRVLEPARIRNILIKKMEDAINFYKEFEYDTQMSKGNGIVDSSNELEENDMNTTSRAAQPVLCIRFRTSLSKFTEAFDEKLGKIGAYLAELGETPVGCPYAAYYNSDMQDLDTEIGFPVSGKLSGKGDIKFREIPAMENAVTVTHKGSYGSLNSTYEIVYNYIAENKLTMAGPHYDFYTNDPSVTPESELLTEVIIPVSTEPMALCQSCAMPIGNEEMFGTKQDGSKSEDYCSYCYKDGKFTQDVTMEGMIDICMKYMNEYHKNDPGFDADTEINNMRSYFPTLKRWKNTICK